MTEQNLPMLETETQTQLPIAVEVEKARAVQEVQAAMVIAKKFPRDEVDAEAKIVSACRRYSLADSATYSFPRGGEKVEGPSIRLAEVLARHWGNLNFGFRELDKNEGKSQVEAFCWDLESNTKITRQFSVDHRIQLKGGKMKILTDPRDIYEIMANQAQRRVRACILGIIPGDIIEKAVEVCRKTLIAGEKAEPLIDRVKRMVLAFGDLGVTKEMIEKRLGHGVDIMTAEEVADYVPIFNSIKEKASSREDWFEFKKKEMQSPKSEELSKKLLSPSDESKTAE